MSQICRGRRAVNNVQRMLKGRVLGDILREDPKRFSKLVTRHGEISPDVWLDGKVVIVVGRDIGFETVDGDDFIALPGPGGVWSNFKDGVVDDVDDLPGACPENAVLLPLFRKGGSEEPNFLVDCEGGLILVVSAALSGDSFGYVIPGPLMGRLESVLECISIVLV